MSRTLIDGSVLEGGGQILRNTIAFSSLLQKPVLIHKIRSGRKPPGLKNQHRTGLELAARIASGELVGAENGSCDVQYNPGQIRLPGHHTADCITAGSTTLLLQIALPLLLFSREPTTASTLTLKGGTNAANAPQIDYSQHILFPFLRRHWGLDLRIDIKRRGYFPKGGGEVFVVVQPTSDPLEPIRVTDRGSVKIIRGIAHLAGLPGHIGKSMIDGAVNSLLSFAELANVAIEIESKRERNDNTSGAGSGIVLWAELEGGGIIGGSALGKKGLTPAAVGQAAAEELIRGLKAGGCVDEYLQDQIVIFMALAKGTSEVRCGNDGLTLHTTTAIWVAEQLTDAKFTVEKVDSGYTIIRCTGIGFLTPRTAPSEEETSQQWGTGLS